LSKEEGRKRKLTALLRGRSGQHRINIIKKRSPRPGNIGGVVKRIHGRVSSLRKIEVQNKEEMRATFLKKKKKFVGRERKVGAGTL